MDNALLASRGAAGGRVDNALLASRGAVGGRGFEGRVVHHWRCRRRQHEREAVQALVRTGKQSVSRHALLVSSW